MYTSFGFIDADVIVVGAGLSGITAAYTILSRDPRLSVYILEGSSKIGGRINSEILKTCQGEKKYTLSGQFVMTCQDHIVSLCRELQLELIERNNGDGKAIFELEIGEIHSYARSQYGNIFEGIELVKFLAKFEVIVEEVSLLNPTSILNYKYLDETSMETYITEHLKREHNRNFIRYTIRAFLGVDATKISVLFYAAFCNSTSGVINQFLSSSKKQQRYLIVGGSENLYLRMIEEQIDKDSIIKDDPVVSIIRSDDDQNIIQTEKGLNYRSRCVVVAVPPKQILNITFDPTLSSARLNVLSNMLQSHMTKFVVTYEKAFWKDMGLSGDIFCIRGVGPISICFDITETDTPALSGYICEEPQKQSFRDKVLDHLARYFGKDALSPLDYSEVNYNYDVNAGLCCGSYPSMNMMKRYEEIRRPAGRIFWAGTESSSYWNGYMCGAVQAGYRAGIEILYELRPQSLAVIDITNLHPRSRRIETAFRQSPINYWSNWKTYIPFLITFTIVFVMRKKLISCYLYIRNLASGIF